MALEVEIEAQMEVMLYPLVDCQEAWLEARLVRGRDGVRVESGKTCGWSADGAWIRPDHSCFGVKKGAKRR